MYRVWLCLFFAGFGKSTFLKVFFQHASFTNNVSQGTLASTCDTSWELGFLSFVRLIVTVYFQKHLPFVYNSPRALLNSFSGSDPISQHKQWLHCIRSTVWENIEFEDELPPSWEALRRHWLYSCWVSHFWSQANNDAYHLLDVNEFGWRVVEGCLEIDWNDPSNFNRWRRVCVFYYVDVGVRKDVVIKDLHASKLVLSVVLDVDVLIVRTYPPLDLCLMKMKWSKNSCRVITVFDSHIILN